MVQLRTNHRDTEDTKKRKMRRIDGCRLRPLLIISFALSIGTTACSPKAAKGVNTSQAGSYIETGSKPSWTPDGKSLVISHWIDGNYELSLLELESGAVKRITRNQAYDGSPAVSPDGKHVAFESTAGGNRAIHVTSMDGANIVRIGSIGEDCTQSRSPVWFPDGSRVLFVALQGGKPDLFLAKPDGRDVRPLSKTQGYRESPGIAVKGGLVAFRTPGNPNFGISKMSLDGANETPSIAEDSAVDWPSWNNDSSRMAYVRYENGGSAVYVRDLGTGNSVRVSPPSTATDWHWHPEWSPDGKWIAFNEHAGPVWGIAIVQADGAGYSRIRTSPKWEGHPVWNPDSSRIAFFSSADRGFYIVDLEGKFARRVR